MRYSNIVRSMKYSRIREVIKPILTILCKKGLCINPHNNTECTDCDVYNVGSIKHQLDPEGSRILPSIQRLEGSQGLQSEATASGFTLDYMLRILPSLCRLQVQLQPSAASVFSFPPWVLAISCEVGIKVANDTEGRKDRLKTPAQQKSCF